MRNKVAVIGAGNVGASLALYLAEDDVADVVLLDIVEGMPQGKALDLLEAAPIRGYDSRVIGSNDYSEMKGADIVVVTAGVARKPGMSREDLLNTNSKILSEVVDNIVRYAPDSFILTVTNPLDIMTYHAFKKSGFPKHRVFGQAGVLDTTRYRSFIALELGVSFSDVQAMVLGGHGDSMVPLPRYTTVSGVSVTELLPESRIKEIVDRTRTGGGEIVKLLKTGSAYYAPAASVALMVKSILKDEKKLLPASAYLEGEYKTEDIYIGVPIILGAGGVEKIVQLDLTDEEQEMFDRSVKTYREYLEIIGY